MLCIHWLSALNSQCMADDFISICCSVCVQFYLTSFMKYTILFCCSSERREMVQLTNKQSQLPFKYHNFFFHRFQRTKRTFSNINAALSSPFQFKSKVLFMRSVPFKLHLYFIYSNTRALSYDSTSRAMAEFRNVSTLVQIALNLCERTTSAPRSHHSSFEIILTKR